MVVHILQHILYTDLLAVAYAPYGIELQAFRHRRLQDEHRCSTAARDEVSPLRTERRYGLCKHRMVVTVHQTDTVGADEGGTILLAQIQYALFQLSSSRGLFTKSCRDDDERTHVLVACKQFHIVRTERRRHDEDGQDGGRQVSSIMQRRDSLHLRLLGVHHPQFSLIAAIDQVAYNGSTRFVYIVGATDDHNAPRR